MSGLNVLGENTGESREQILERALLFSFEIDDWASKEAFLRFVSDNDLEVYDKLNGWPEFMEGATKPREEE